MEETIVAISTPPGEGGIGVIRLSGSQAIPIGQHIFHSKISLGRRVRYAEYGSIHVEAVRLRGDRGGTNDRLDVGLSEEA